MASPSSQPLILDYATVEPVTPPWHTKVPWRKLRNIGLWLFALASLGWLGQATIRYASQAIQRNTELNLCASHVLPPNTVVFDESLKKWPAAKGTVVLKPTTVLFRERRDPATTISSDDLWKVRGENNWRYPTPDCYGRYLSNHLQFRRFLNLNRQDTVRLKCSPGIRQPWPGPSVDDRYFAERYQSFVFLHKLRSPKGNDRLVCLSFDGPSYVWDSPEPFEATVLPIPHSDDTFDWACSYQPLPFKFPDPNTIPIRLYAGQPDPSDASHFTIDYDHGQTRRTIHAYLHDDDTLSLTEK